jgi:hypothetical protein
MVLSVPAPDRPSKRAAPARAPAPAQAKTPSRPSPGQIADAGPAKSPTPPRPRVVPPEALPGGPVHPRKAAAKPSAPPCLPDQAAASAPPRPRRRSAKASPPGVSYKVPGRRPCGASPKVQRRSRPDVHNNCGTPRALKAAPSLTIPPGPDPKTVHDPKKTRANHFRTPPQSAVPGRQLSLQKSSFARRSTPKFLRRSGGNFFQKFPPWQPEVISSPPLPASPLPSPLNSSAARKVPTPRPREATPVHNRNCTTPAKNISTPRYPRAAPAGVPDERVHNGLYTIVRQPSAQGPAGMGTAPLLAEHASAWY